MSSVFPREVEFLVLDHLRNRRDVVLRCSMVCKAWRIVLLSTIFKALTVRMASKSRNMDAFVQFLERSPKASSRIQRIMITGRPNPSVVFVTLRSSQLAHVLKTLPRLSSLQVHSMLFTWLDEPILELTGRFQLRFLELQDMLVEVPQSEDGGHGIDGPLLGIRAFLRMFSSISVMQLGDIAFYGSVDSRHPSFPIEALGTDDYTPPSVQELNLCDGFPTSGWASLISSCIIFAPSASLLFTDQMGPSVLQNICEGQALSIVHLQLTLGKGISGMSFYCVYVCLKLTWH